MRLNHAYPALLALMLTATLAGCGREPLPVADRAIRFSAGPAASTSLETKTDGQPSAAGTALIKDGSSVKLYGSAASATDPLFAGTDLICTESSGTFTWGYTPLRYWDQGATYYFRAVFTDGNDSKIDATDSNSDQVVVAYAMSDNYDLMVASTPGISANTQVDNGNPAVGLVFLHACAAVRFNFTKAADDNTDYTIAAFSLRYVHVGATLTYDGGDSSASGAAVALTDWAPTATDRPENAYTAATSIGSVPATAGWFFMVPQALYDGSTSATDASVRFSYTIGTDATPHVVTLNLEKFKDAPVTWEPGKTYTYNIEIHPETINFTVTCENWAAGKDDVVIGPIG